METPSATKDNLFKVFLRLRPPPAGVAPSERFLTVEPQSSDSTSSTPTHVTLTPPSNARKHATEKYCFTQVLEEDASQLDVFQGTGVIPLIEGVLGPNGGDGTDALLATLGVTGAGKTHTLLGSKTQRGMTQLSLEVLFRSIGQNIASPGAYPPLETSVAAYDASEATILSASAFLESVFADPHGPSRSNSRAPTPMIGESAAPPLTPRRLLNRPSSYPTIPDVGAISVPCDPSAEYAVLVSMYEVYNNAIHDLLTPPIRSAATKEYRRRALLFKATELSPDRKVVAGLKKILCTNLQQALMVLEAGLQERSVAGTNSNRTSSRSHGFFCVEVKKRRKSRRQGHSTEAPWAGSTFTIVDLAGSERAREAKTTGVTLAEAGKINESLMYFGQCLQLQATAGNSAKPTNLSFRHCKLTEILFSNNFASNGFSKSYSARRAPQKGVLIVNADPHGEFSSTSQILRYSALACEVMAPRIPSITQTILAAAAKTIHPNNHREANNTMLLSSSPISSSPAVHHRPFFPPGSVAGSSNSVPQYNDNSPNIQRTFSPASNSSSDDRATMEAAALEIARLSEELEYMRQSCETERARRVEAEDQLLSVEDRLIDLEQEIREDCAAEFEQRLAVELARWKASMELEKERGEEHWDRKIEVYERAANVQVLATDGDENDGDNKENVLIENLEEENTRLRREVQVLKRELLGRSPTKRKPLAERDDLATEDMAAPHQTGDSLHSKMEQLRVSEVGRASSTSNSSRATVQSTAGGSPRKVRKLVAKRWDLSAANDDGF
ncbi:hypothetical protein MCOR27_002627 [Pyricularia oryzae]|uniref:Kinesin-like protein n=2 Tax=Pyricularia TaxID=48558 RepID=A0ABQ8NJ66_PYRGI|nr:kinesin family protein [Pyricularia oryzae 70-15]KAH8847955.1 hypothetical protein MCOR01_001352 [Pyricularia oryzae]KAI6297794.1 hypothetical protein MCOR33_005965 [Pyricularia grisea]EHA52766.1 kinesin family protein [Pyricularia oryzae 70-15]KAH9430105.1 hypothetical protein MCOR02_009823 [Pyricularia oryzae]KAI6258619.1 hypothetical protein MCOR19_005001 [Pyricularia oryzae]